SSPSPAVTPALPLHDALPIFAAKVHHAGADRPLGGVLGVRDRDDHVVLVRHRDTVMRSAHADGANLELLVKDGLLRKNTHLVLKIGRATRLNSSHVKISYAVF